MVSSIKIIKLFIQNICTEVYYFKKKNQWWNFWSSKRKSSLIKKKIIRWVKRFEIFCYMLVCGMRLKQFKLWKVLAVVGSIMVVDVLTCHALLRSICDLKAAQMNMQHSLIWEIMCFELELNHCTMEATTNICCVKKWKHSWYQKPNSSRSFAWITRILTIRQGQVGQKP